MRKAQMMKKESVLSDRVNPTLPAQPDIRSQVLIAVWDAFAAAGIRIPYAQLDVHVHSGTGADPLRNLETDQDAVHNAASIHQIRPA